MCTRYGDFEINENPANSFLLSLGAKRMASIFVTKSAAKVTCAGMLRRARKLG